MSSIADLTAAPPESLYEDDFEEEPAVAAPQPFVEAMAATAQLHIDNSERMAELRERELRRQSSSIRTQQPLVPKQKPVLQQRLLNSMSAALPSMIASVASYTSHHLLRQPCEVPPPPRGRLAPHLLDQLAKAMEQMQQEAASLHLKTTTTKERGFLL